MTASVSSPLLVVNATSSDYQSVDEQDSQHENHSHQQQEQSQDSISSTSLVPQLPPHLDKNKFTPSFLTRFLPWSYYLVYLLLTAMQELPLTSIQWILNNTTKFTPQELTIYYNFTFIPWTIKPLWGFIADNISICGYRRKPYMILASLLSLFVFVGIPFFATDKVWMRVFGVVNSFCIVFSEVQIDGLVVMYSNTLLDQQSALYRQFPEFKLLVQDEEKKEEEKEEEKDEKKEDNKAEENNIVEHNSSTENPYITLPPSPDSSENNPAVPKVQTYTSSDEIFIANPHYHDILQPNEYHLMMTKLPKAAIQSEAMTFRTASSLCSSLMSLFLHLFLAPRQVVWLSGGLPILLIITILLILTEKNQIIAQAFRHRLKVIISSLSHYTGSAEYYNVDGYGKLVEDNKDNDNNNNNEESIYDQSNNKISSSSSSSSSDNLSAPSPTKMERFIDSCHCDEHKTLNKSPSGEKKPLLKSNQISEVTMVSSTTTTTDSDALPSASISPKLCFNCLCTRIVSIFNAILLIWKPLLFMLILRSMPTPMDPMMSFIFGHLTLPPWLLSAYSFIMVSGGLLGSIIYWKYFINIPIVPSFIVFTILSSSLGAVPNFMLTNEWVNAHLKIPNWTMVFIGTFFSEIFSRFALMPTLILAAETAPQHFGLEATMFSIYTATNNIGNVLGAFVNVFLMKKLHITTDNYHNLSLMIVICSISSIIPLVFSPLIYCTQRDLKRIEAERQEKRERRAVRRVRKRERQLARKARLTNTIQHLSATTPDDSLAISSSSDSGSDRVDSFGGKRIEDDYQDNDLEETLYHRQNNTLQSSQ